VTTSSYSDSNHPFDFHVEPEPEPPALANGSDGVKSNTPNGSSKTENSSESTDKLPEEERTWTSLTLPGAVLNSSVYIIGKTIEVLAPYWPSSEQRQKVQSLAQAHPVLASFLIMQAMFLLVPIIGFAAFVAAMAVVVVGASVLFVIGVGLGVGVMVFMPGVLVAGVWAGVVWSWAYVGFRATMVAWSVYKNSSYYRALSQGGDQEESKEPNEPSRKQLEEPKMGNGADLAYRQGGYLSAEEKRPASANSLASSTVKVESGYGGESRSGEFSDDDDDNDGDGDDDDRTVNKEYARGVKEGDRDEDKVGRDIMRSLG